MATPHTSLPACQRKIMCLIPQTLPVHRPSPPLLTSMGKWANGKLKVEHVAAPQGEAGQQQRWASVLWSVLSFFGDGRFAELGGGGRASSGWL